MEDYPLSYVARPRPLVFLSGFGSRSLSTEVQSERPFRHGTRINSGMPAVEGNYAECILREFLAFDPGDRPTTTDLKPMHFRMKAVERSYELPCRKSSPAPRSPGSTTTAPALHSSLSPFSPSSPLCPDGIMHPLWPHKWQELVPAVWISAFSLSSHPTEDASNDEALKNEINDLKAALNEPYHIRLAVILIGHATTTNAPNIEERISNLRRGTKLDSKTGILFVRPDLSQEDLSAFVSASLTPLRPTAQEYYRDLTKHARRKKERLGYTSPTLATENPAIQALSRSGWTARYEYKLGVFAEFRFEMDAASRHLYAALDALFDSDGVFENLSNWSPRWNEVRMFADTIALRQIRCLLANGMPLPAVRFWTKYRDTTQYILNRRGKGTASYGWKAWEARWAKIMAQLVQASPGCAIDLLARKTLEGISSGKTHVYLELGREQPAEERIEPWELLHHPGYWLYYSGNLSASRRTLALSMPEEDRIPPGQSPATRVARRSEIYDTYLCPDPHMEYPATEIEGFNHSHEIVQTLEEALSEFQQRNQVHMAGFIKLKIAKELEGNLRASDSLDIIRHLWKNETWRESKWPTLTKDVATTLYRTAGSGDDFAAQLLAFWELLVFEPSDGIQYDLDDLLSNIKTMQNSESQAEAIVLKHGSLESFFELSFNFGSGEAHASEPMRAQLILSSKLNIEARPVIIKSLKVNFEGGISNISIVDTARGKSVGDVLGTHQLCDVDLSEDQEDIEGRSVTSYTGKADITVLPGHNRVYNMVITPREAGIITAMTAEAIIQTQPFEVRYVKDLPQDLTASDWWFGKSEKPRKRTALRNPTQINVQPKLPKVRVNFANLQDSYYIGETLTAEIDVLNEEASTVDVTLDVRIPGHDHLPLNVRVVSQTVEPDAASKLTTSSLLPLHSLESYASKRVIVQIHALPTAMTAVLQVKATYTMEAPLTTTTSADIVVLKPFQAQYSISPDLHPAPWPSFFELTDGDDGADYAAESTETAPLQSLTNRWAFQVALQSLASDRVRIRNLVLDLRNVSEGAVALINNFPKFDKPALLIPKTTQEVTFGIDTSRTSLEDLRTTAVEAVLKVHWTRAEPGAHGDTIVTTMPTPRLTFPSSEPRVLAARTVTDDDNLIFIDLILENPSMHFLSFSISLEPDESFVFSGAKSITKHLLPISRHTVRYTIMPLQRDRFISPLFKVVDVHFNKSLNINPTGDLRTDQGVLMVWTGPGDIPPPQNK